ncbi:MAG: hypothetical protein ACTSPI_00465 [Candidatus Heimdallarchaeaceae archaeon]
MTPSFVIDTEKHLEKIRRDALLTVVSQKDMDWMIKTLFWYIKEYKRLINRS